jgi:hypothetical protein
MLKIYVDTSVIGGCLDDEFSVWSCALFDEFRVGLKIPVISDLTLQELEHAPVEVRRLLSSIEDYSSGIGDAHRCAGELEF